MKDAMFAITQFSGNEPDHQTHINFIPNKRWLLPRSGAIGKFALLYPSSLNTPVVVYTHPGAHTYPSEADTAVVKFFKANPHP